ncbi:oxidoreductase, short chain dehydrogenase/reductase family protein [Hallella bergensis DSM 17361]|uniref:Oxidoreductase, short chain dehydrogenase/reductase family protein n=1 Tax=Hallella bergensis DSM 17361 TaxID=585502 RepID=D1PUZ0_9BACT|nr:SDR family NAD(P)-dependent oxidoreductase [Hallella bergensis]EFA44710.1 oxidoreductase, short chain dehydrogenase/reductase family protein [Hallella bergensis DSM 17361]
MKQKAIVMGASSGLGMEVAKRLIRDGWQVGLAARRVEILETLGETHADRPVVARIDVTADDAAEKMRALIEKLGGVDLYFHASGIGKQNPELDADIEQNTIQTNGFGFARMVGEVFRWMATHGGGHIAVISSIAGTKGLGPAASYSATKSFQGTYIQALEQLSNNRKLNIRFTDLRPGFVDTDLIRGSHFPMTLSVDEVADEMMAAITHGMHVRIIDWRWRIVVKLWRLLPSFVWRRLRLTGAKDGM